MNLITKKRFVAFVIDTILLIVLIMIISSFIPTNKIKEGLIQKQASISEEYLNKEINLKIYINKYAPISREIDILTLPTNIANIIVILIYYMVVPYITNGKTVGLYLTKLRIVTDNKEKLRIKHLFIRSLITSGLAYLMISITITMIINNIFYFILITALTIIQVLLLITSTIMITKSKDNVGLQDIFSKTKIIRNKEV